MINGLKPCLKQVAPMMRPQMVVTTIWAIFRIGLAYHLDIFTICLVYEAIGHVIATVETPFRPNGSYSGYTHRVVFEGACSRRWHSLRFV